MTKHINPGTDTTINPVVIDDSYREKKHKGMEHCNHECVCKGYVLMSRMGWPLQNRGEACIYNERYPESECPHDTRSNTSTPSQPTLYKTQTDDDGAIGKVAICLCEQCKVNGFLCIKSPRAIGVPSAKVQQCIAAVIGELEAMEEKSTSNDIASAGYRTGLRKAIALLQAGRK